MLNLEMVGGISFTKGCYPGQEIVARTQYRGEIKRRTFLAHVDDGAVPAAGVPIFDAASPQQALGTVVMAAAAPSGGFDALVCLHVDLAGRAELRLGDPQGPRLYLSELPYQLPVAL